MNKILITDNISKDLNFSKDQKAVLQHAENMLAEGQSLDSIREFIERHYPENAGGWPTKIIEWYNNAYTVMVGPNASDSTNLSIISTVHEIGESSLSGESADDTQQ